jgi:GMP synthase-like glutamine amidotransferase
MQKLKIHCLQHAPHEGPGYVIDYAKKYGHSLNSTKFYKDEELPELDSFDVLLIMGGPMSVYDENNYPWLKQEKGFISEAITNNKKIIGICLGSQLLAAVLGARVFPNNEQEIGFFPVFKKSSNDLFEKFPDNSIVFQWHGDTFDLPKDAELLASSEACINQAFAVDNNILALQFHLEITEELLKGFLKSGKDELLPKPYIQNEESIINGFKFIPACNFLLEELLKKFLNDS